ncbi:hypothetical protein J7T55_007215 [Diaporthe amygdali]|uniref:uncharacterized protein n=1 Tax=Phomopsis amygdali TaxID=1214568 RepID=UPI0022FDCCEA|nr:uncharacterized protein J7T55_007215 [Diaporthe amygdali]KAJ0108096.1 hypothetical protein J7T55_007215 [Diaporthe amygdali]
MAPVGNPSQYDKVVAEFLQNYKKQGTQERFEKLAALTRKECENILERIHVKGVVQSRTKRYQSLEKKLNEMARDTEFRDWVSKKENDILRHSEMGDLAGVRIGLYLPDDVIKVSKELDKHFDRQHLFGTVTGGRDPAQGRNLDVQQHANGPWQSRDLNGDIEHWQHYGYKSWQMVVKWRASSSLPENLKPLRVEIQVGTVVTQAWGEVQHDIIYKRPAEILATPTMKRMIDAINGLAITTEIMLVELARSLEVAKKEAENARRAAEKKALEPFASGEEFSKWFKSTYMAKMRPEERERWASSSTWADVLVQSSRGVPAHAAIMKHTSPKEVRRITASRAELGKLIEEKKILVQPRKKTDKALDIGRLLLEALGYKLHHLD